MAKFQIVPISKTGERLQAEKTEFTSLEKARDFLVSTQDRWSDYPQVLIVNKKSGKTVEYWQEI